MAQLKHMEHLTPGLIPDAGPDSISERVSAGCSLWRCSSVADWKCSWRTDGVHPFSVAACLHHDAVLETAEIRHPPDPWLNELRRQAARRNDFNSSLLQPGFYIDVRTLGAHTAAVPTLVQGRPDGCSHGRHCRWGCSCPWLFKLRGMCKCEMPLAVRLRDSVLEWKRTAALPTRGDPGYRQDPRSYAVCAAPWRWG